MAKRLRVLFTALKLKGTVHIHGRALILSDDKVYDIYNRDNTLTTLDIMEWFMSIPEEDIQSLRKANALQNGKKKK